MTVSPDTGRQARVKICGIQRPEDAVEAARAGADFVGLVFVPGRRRRLDTEDARHIVEVLRADVGVAPRVVGLFADQPLDEVCRAVGGCGLDMVQLCGGESPGYAGLLGVPVIKVVHVPLSQDPEGTTKHVRREMEDFRNEGHMITLDRKVGGLQGGTGESFDWRIAGALSSEGFSFLLAGGLTPENVGDAVRTARPWGVDVSSGVESDGSKDPFKIRAFVHAAKAAQGNS